MISFLNQFNHILWARLLAFLLIGLGILLTIRLKGVQFRYLPYSLKLAFTRSDNASEGDISQFQALMTALAATIGIASIAGVSTAIVAGGFGSIFWMWVIALLGMATKYAEAFLALLFRETNDKGEMCGGPMYYIKKGLGWKKLAIVFAFFGSLSAFAGGNLIQSNSIAHALSEIGYIPELWTGIVIAITTAIVLFKGIKSIGKICAILVPVMAGFYLLGTLIILLRYITLIPEGLYIIVKDAFRGEAAVGGFLGATVMAAVQFGVARGVSSSEAGLGSAPIAAAAAKTDVPGRQALISMSSAFLSTMIVCTMTALVISVTHVLGSVDHSGNLLNGVALVMAAFKSVIPHGEWIVAIGVVLFGYSTIVGWAYYGEKCFTYVLGEKFLPFYRFLYCVVAFFGAILSLDLVWPIVDIMNGFMALPNIIALFALSSLITAESEAFFTLLRREKQVQKASA